MILNSNQLLEGAECFIILDLLADKQVEEKLMVEREEIGLHLLVGL